MAIPTATTPIYDPDLPVYADPNVEREDVAVEQKPIDDYIDPDKATVQGQIKGILSESNPMGEMVRADATRQYHGRGLLNTGQSVTAGTTALLRNATEIATPDAMLYGDMAKNQQATDQQALLANQQDALSTTLEKNRARLSGALTTQEQQGQAEMQKVVDAAQMRRIEVDNQWKQMVNWDNLDAQMQVSLGGVSQVFGESLTSGIERIMRDTNVEDKTSAIEALMTTYKTQMQTASSILGIDLTW